VSELAKAHEGLDLEDTEMSYNEWKACGFYIIKGSKCVGWSVDGYGRWTAMLNLQQTRCGASIVRGLEASGNGFKTN